MPLAGVRGALRAECGVLGTGGESVGLTTPGELPESAPAGEPRELAPCTGEPIAGDDILCVREVTEFQSYAVSHNRFSCRSVRTLTVYVCLPLAR